MCCLVVMNMIVDQSEYALMDMELFMFYVFGSKLTISRWLVKWQSVRADTRTIPHAVHGLALELYSFRASVLLLHVLLNMHVCMGLHLSWPQLCFKLLIHFLPVPPPTPPLSILFPFFLVIL